MNYIIPTYQGEDVTKRSLSPLNTTEYGMPTLGLLYILCTMYIFDKMYYVLSTTLQVAFSDSPGRFGPCIDPNRPQQAGLILYEIK